MKTLALIALMTLTACARAEWQENPGSGAAAQEQQKGDPGANPAPTPFPDPIKFSECESQTLNATVDTASSKTNLQDFKTVMARYPQILATRASKTKLRSVYFLNAKDENKKACANEACAEQSGWSQIQDDIHSLNGVTLSCEGEAATATGSL